MYRYEHSNIGMSVRIHDKRCTCHSVALSSSVCEGHSGMALNILKKVMSDPLTRRMTTLKYIKIKLWHHQKEWPWNDVALSVQKQNSIN